MPHMGEYSKAHAIADLFARIKTGTYTGDGSTSQAITGIGFAPKLVRIWMHETSEWTATADCFFEKNDQMAGDICACHTASANYHRLPDNRLISLDADGFTVDDDGGDSHPNKADQAYDYVCLG